MQRQETFPVLPLSYLDMTQEESHDIDIPESLMASSRSAGVLIYIICNRTILTFILLIPIMCRFEVYHHSLSNIIYFLALILNLHVTDAKSSVAVHSHKTKGRQNFCY